MQARILLTVGDYHKHHLVGPVTFRNGRPSPAGALNGLSQSVEQRSTTSWLKRALVQIRYFANCFRLVHHVSAFGIELDQRQGRVIAGGLLFFQKAIKPLDGVILDRSHGSGSIQQDSDMSFVFHFSLSSLSSTGW